MATGCNVFTPVTPVKALTLLNDPSRPDFRREGIAALVTRWDFGKRPPYLELYKRLAEKDPDVTVRAMAIRASNICRDKTATQIFLAGLKDESEQIRLESVKALANVPDPQAVAPLLELLGGSRIVYDADGERNQINQSKDIRIAAADALRQYHNRLEVDRRLVEFLNGNDFGVAWQCHKSLVELTGQDLHYDEAAWLKYLVAGKG